MNLLVVEMRRALHRRLVWVLLVLALIGCALAGVIAFTDSAGKTVLEMTQYEGEPQTHPAVVAGWWVAGGADGILMIAALPLLMGGLLGGASVVGAEWRANTVATVLTWEPRRVRLHVARTASAGILAAAIAFALQAIFLAAFLPAVVMHGSAAGLDGEFWASLVAAMIRVSLVTGFTAVIGSALATFGRNTAFGIGAAFVWIAVLENVFRGLKPGLGTWFLGENIAVLVTWAPMQDARVTPGTTGALLWLSLLVLGAAALATMAFARQDVAA